MANPQQQSFEWVKRAIETSENRFHIEACEKLIDLFIVKYGKEQEDELKNILSEKIKSILYL